MARMWRLQVLVLGGLLGFVSIAVAWSWARDSSPWVSVADLDDVSAERPLFHEETKVYVIKGPDGILALLGRGPWRAEKVEFCVSSKMFEAPVSGSKFDRYGNYYGGPAPRGMTRVPVKVEGGEVLVRPNDPVAGPPRGEAVAQEPEGPLCLSI